ncbi:hypothetical protein FQN57_001159 [Myotisia sp. PD_48]|nr:hypothetical protein FQN57_001159 [Myotisia sp. PD_48]
MHLQFQSQSQTQIEPQPQSQPGSTSSDIDLIQSALKRQTVDAGTQYSRPSTPSERPPVPVTSSQHPHENCLLVPSNSQPQSQSNPRMPGTTTLGSKRNTPDAAKVLTGASSSSSSLSKSKSKSKSIPQAQSHPPSSENAIPSEGSASKRLRPETPAQQLLPRRYEDVEPRVLVTLISSMLMELIRRNDPIPLRDGRLTRFHSRSPPRISVKDYLQRLTTHATLSPPILLSMVYYIDRLCALYPAFTISSLTVHRFLISSSTVASKGLSDSFWTNKTYARVGGISVEELALLELEFLFRVEWRIVPQPEVLTDYYCNLVQRSDQYALEPPSPPPPDNASS